MAKNGIELRKTDTILDELNRLQRQIGERAYELFRHRDGQWGDALSDWLNAEHELVWTPAVELRQKDGQFEVLAEHAANAGTVHTCELKAGKAFRSVHFPSPIDPNSVKATYHDGLLQLKASIANGAAPQRVNITTT